MSKRWEYRRTVFFEEELMDKIRKYGNEGWELCNIVESRREIFTSIPNSTITPVNVKIINDCIFKREIYVKPIEDKEPTAFQWSDELVTDIVMGTVEAVLKKEPIFLPHFINDFKKSKISQSIPAGKGTANDVSSGAVTSGDGDHAKKIYNAMRVGYDNICPITKEPCDDECCPPNSICNLSHEGGSEPTANETINEEKKWDWHGEKNHTITDNPVLDRQDDWLNKYEKEHKEYFDNLRMKICNTKKERWDLKWEDGRAVLNRNDDGKWMMIEYNNISYKFTEEDLRRAFYDAHLKKGDRYVYNTFEDYKNSLK